MAAFCNVPDEETARTMARSLIDGRLAACVNILTPCASVYRWEGKTEEEKEIPMLIKTIPEKVPALREAITNWHPFDTPELIILPITDGLPDYLKWVREECQE